MKTSGLDPAAAPNGSEIIPVLQTVGGVTELVKMPAADLAEAGTRPTPAELQAAVIATLIEGGGINFVVDGVAGTITIEVDAADLVTNASLAAALATKQDASDLLQSIADLVLAGNAGKVIKVNPTEDGFELATDDAGTGGGALVDGTYGDVIISGGGTVLTVVIAADEAYGAGWNADLGPATKNALYTKLEAMVAATAGKVANSSVGVANGVASLDATGKVPAGQLPSYVDDVLEYANTSAFPAVGETGKIYVALDTNRQSRWSGSAYVELTASPGTTDNVPEGSGNLYFTDARARGATATGLADTVGTPAATDSILTILGKVRKALFTDIATTIRATVATGLADTAGTPAAADSILTILGKIKKTVFTDGFAPKTPQGQTLTNQASITPTFSNDFVALSGQAQNLTINAPTGTAVDEWGISLRMKATGAFTITWNAIYRAVGVTLPTAFVANKWVRIGMIYNATDAKWDVVAVAPEA